MESAVNVISCRVSGKVWVLCACLLATPAWAAPPNFSGKTNEIEAVKGKKYVLGPQHGPWMIMVASLSEPPPEYRADGPGPVEAAHDLVYELRKKGIPAYFFEQQEEIQPLHTLDHGGRAARRVVKAKDHRVCVIAGNYPSADDTVAQKTLNWIKDFSPPAFKEHAVFHPTPGRPKPLSGAFLTINPLLSPADLAQQQTDPLLLKLNTGRKYSLLNNQGKYTLVVASFRGKAELLSKSENRDLEISKALDEAGYHAEILCQLLREQKLHHQRQFDAYVWHDRDRSLVCVGAFDSENDPLIPRMFELFAECKQLHRATDTEVVMAQYLMVPEPDKSNWVFPKLSLAVRRNREVAPLPRYTFAFDPKPQLMRVPMSGNKSR
jgi:hypothetical protein